MRFTQFSCNKPAEICGQKTTILFQSKSTLSEKRSTR